MYLHLLDTDELDAFLCLAKELLSIDDEFCEIERNALQVILSQFNRTEEDIQVGVDQAIMNLADRQSRLISLIELVGLAYVDSSFCEKEKEFLRFLLESWGIEDDAFLQINEWVIQLVNIDREINSLIREEL